MLRGWGGRGGGGQELQIAFVLMVELDSTGSYGLKNILLKKRKATFLEISIPLLWSNKMTKIN